MAKCDCLLLLSNQSTSDDHTRKNHSQNTVVSFWTTAFLTISLMGVARVLVRTPCISKQTKQSLGRQTAWKIDYPLMAVQTPSLCTLQSDCYLQACLALTCIHTYIRYYAYKRLLLLHMQYGKLLSKYLGNLRSFPPPPSPLPPFPSLNMPYWHWPRTGMRIDWWFHRMQGQSKQFRLGMVIIQREDVCQTQLQDFHQWTCSVTQ